MIKAFFALLLMTTSVFAQDCTIARSVSKNQKGEMLFGNAFAISEKRLVLNEHSLAENSQILDLETNSGEKFKAKIIHQDFHTDLAIIEVLSSRQLRPCRLSSSQDLSQQTAVEIEGFDGKNQNTSRLNGRLVQTRSTRIQIPGIKTGLEITNAPIRQSMSGSPVFSNRSVVGILAQVSDVGSALAIPSEKIQEYILQIEKNKLPERRYTFQKSQNSFSFDGLELKGSFQVKKISPMMKGGTPHEGMGGNPHEGKGGNPHEGMLPSLKTSGIYSPNDQNTNVALKDLNIGYAVASVQNMKILFSRQPHVAELINATKAKVIYIKSIDGMEVRSLFDLIRALGECQKCRIDNFYLESEVTATVSNQYLNAITLLSKLLDRLSNTQKPSLIQKALPSFDLVNQSLNNLAEDLALMSGISNQNYSLLIQNWDQLEQDLRNAFLKDEEQDLMMDLRGLIYEKPRLKN